MRVFNFLLFILVLFLIPQVLCAQGGSQGTANASSQAAELAEADNAAKTALTLFTAGKYEEALGPAQRALDIQIKIRGKDAPQTRLAQLNVAEIYIALHKYREADSLLSQVIESYERLLPADPVLPRIYARMALVQYNLGNLQRTENLYEKSIALLERLYGADDARLIPALFGFAEYLQVTGKLEKAEPLYQRATALREKSTSKQGPGLGAILDRYACLLRKAGRRSEALEIERRLDAADSNPFTLDEDTAVEQEVLNGKALSLPKPTYPDQANAVRAQGTVVVRVLISESGDVIRGCAVSGPSTLLQVSEMAARLAKFSPTRVAGKSVRVRGVITYSFVRQ